MKKQTLKPFIPAGLDDAGLSCKEFRLLCRVMRRAGASGVCRESVRSLSDSLHISRNWIKPVAMKLAGLGLVEIIRWGARSAPIIRPVWSRISAICKDQLAQSDTQIENHLAQSDTQKGKNLAQSTAQIENQLAQSDQNLAQSEPNLAHSAATKGIQEGSTNKDIRDYVAECWNSTADKFGLAKIRDIGGTRLRTLNTRLKEKTWRDDFTELIGKIEGLPRFYFGDNEREWRMDFDYVLKPGNVGKLLEKLSTPKPKAKQKPFLNGSSITI